MPSLPNIKAGNSCTCAGGVVARNIFANKPVVTQGFETKFSKHTSAYIGQPVLLISKKYDKKKRVHKFRIFMIWLSVFRIELTF